MSESVVKTSRWIYQGVWGILVRWFRVPEHPPTLPIPPGETLAVFSPSPDWLRYLKLQFWVFFIFQKILWIVLCVVLIIAVPILGILLAIPIVLFLVFLGSMLFIGLHLRFDTTVYVMSRKSMRIRRGIWVIHETTITFENIQNVSVAQGPLQRYYGIADVVVQTAGGGGHHGGGDKQAASMGAHIGLIEGVHNAQEIRDRILGQLMKSTSAGLGDELHPIASLPGNWSRAHIRALGEIRDAVRALAN